MSWRLVVHPRVEAQLGEAFLWYERERAGLGAEFIAAVDEAILALSTGPLLHRVRQVSLGIRWTLTARFPYRVIYAVRDDTILVLAVEHTKRAQTIWSETT